MIQFFAEFRGQVRDFGVAAQLQRTFIGNYGPTVTRRNLRGIAIHCAEAIGNHVEKITVCRLAEAVLMKARRMLHSAHGDYAVAVTLQTVTRHAENLIAVLAAIEKFLIYRQRKSV